MKNYNELFKVRTNHLAIRVIKSYGKWKKSDEIRIIGKQLIRSATSVAANYRASIRARSLRERYHKLCIVVEEADETVFWLELLQESQLIPASNLHEISDEANEIMKVMSAFRKKIKDKLGRFEK